MKWRSRRSGRVGSERHRIRRMGRRSRTSKGRRGVHQ